MIKAQIEEILARYESGEATENDLAFLESFYVQFRNDDFFMTDEEKVNDTGVVWQKINNKIKPVKKLQWRLWYAAALMLTVTSFCFIAIFRYIVHPSDKSVYSNDIGPGSNKAILTLSNGQKIVLDKYQQGFIYKEAQAKILKSHKGEIVYASTISGGNQKAINRMTTPFGGTYSLRLSDNSLVVLDAGSSIEYPVIFQGNERRVKITGQAYFEVAHNPSKPFIVSFANAQIKVLGTHFNISDYANDPIMKTTLLEGSIVLLQGNESVLLKPNEQGILTLSENKIKVAAIDALSEVSWKDNYFRFQKDDIQSIMRKLSRWYNIEVSYEGDISKEEFSGEISRDKNISQVLRMLEYSQSVHFKINGRRVIVMK